MSNIIDQLCKKLKITKDLLKDGEYTNNGATITIKNRMLHNEEGPAYILHSETKYTCIYYTNNKLHRNDGPCKISHDYLNKKLTIEFYFMNKLQRNDGPASININYDNSDMRTKETWYQMGNVHRNDDPACTEKLNNRIVNEKWYSNGVMYKEITPFTEITKKTNIKKFTDQEGNVHNNEKCAYEHMIDGKQLKLWYVNGNLHRDDGPAFIKICDKYVIHKYYVDGIETDKYRTRKILEDIYYLEM